MPLALSVESEVSAMEAQVSTHSMKVPMTKTPADLKEAVLAVLADHSGVSAAEVAASVGIGQSTAGKWLRQFEREGWVRRVPGERRGSGRSYDRWSLVPPKDKATRGPSTGSGPVRLARGELAHLVLVELARHRDEPCSPGQVARALGRSSGAVANALERLVTSGEAVLTAHSPRRYHVAAAGRASTRWKVRGDARDKSTRSTDTGGS
jgi:predicted ArsR family transcriptional regulator